MKNDTVSTAELEPAESWYAFRRRFSDNDRLAALVMSGLEADALVLRLTNVDGLLREEPVGCAGQPGKRPARHTGR